MDNTSLFLLLACSACTFFLARLLGKRWRDKREAERAQQAERELAQYQQGLERQVAERESV